MRFFNLLACLLACVVLFACSDSGEDLYKQGKALYDNNEYTKAVEFFQKAADQGNAKAQCELAVCYTIGKGVPMDEGKGIYWWRKAAKNGNKGAQSILKKAGIKY